MSLEFCHHRLLSFCDRFFDDLRPYAIVQLVPCIAFPVMAIMLPPMYTHSTYWLWAAGFYLLAKVEEAADDTIYNWTYHIVSGHTLKHLCAAIVPVFLTLMLAKRDILPERINLLQTWKISWTKYKENGVETENQTITYTSVPFNGSVLVGPPSCRGFGRGYALLHPRVVNNEQVSETPHDRVTVPDHGPFATYIDNAVNNAKKNVPRLITKKK